MPRYRPVHVGVRWLGHNAGLHVLGGLGVGVTRITYEALVAYPESTLTRLANRLGLDAAAVGDIVAGGTVDLVTDHTVAGNPMRFRVGPTPLRLDDRWRRELRPRDRRIVHLTTWPLLRAYGYHR